MVGANVVLARFIKFKDGLYESCGIEYFESIMLEPCLLQPWDLRRGLFHRGWLQNTRCCLQRHGKHHCCNTDTTCNHIYFETTPFETTPFETELRGRSRRRSIRRKLYDDVIISFNITTVSISSITITITVRKSHVFYTMFSRGRHYNHYCICPL